MQPQYMEPDYAGQHVYAGLDLSKKSWKVHIMVGEVTYKNFTQPPDPKVLVNYLKRTFPGAKYHCVYEAGYSGFWAHEALEAEGVECVVVNPGDVPTTDKEKRNKTDRVDARKLSRWLSSGELRPIYVPARCSQEDRSLVRLRTHFVRNQTRCKQQIKAMMHFYGFDAPEMLSETYWSRSYVNWVEHLVMQRPSGNTVLKSLLAELRSLRGILADVTRQIRILSLEEPYATPVNHLCTVPGISRMTAMIFLTELVDINRFKNLDHLASYAGLAPGEHSSGEREVTTGISSRRNSQLRYVLIESAWVAVRHDPALLLAFTKLSARMKKQKAIVHIAKKLLNRMRYVLKNREPYRCSVVQVAA